MSPTTSINTRRSRNVFPQRKRSQRGDILIESMVSMALVGIIAMGPAYTASRSMVAQSHANAQSAALTQLRTLLHDQGANLCSAAPSPIVVSSVSLPITVTCNPTSATAVTVGGVSVDLTASASINNRVTLSVTSSTLFGSSSALVVSQ